MIIYTYTVSPYSTKVLNLVRVSNKDSTFSLSHDSSFFTTFWISAYVSRSDCSTQTRSFRLLNLYLRFLLYKPDILILSKLSFFFPVNLFHHSLLFSSSGFDKCPKKTKFPLYHFSTFCDFISRLVYFLNFFDVMSFGLPSSRSKWFVTSWDKMDNSLDSSSSDDSSKIIVRKFPLKNQPRVLLEGSSESPSTLGPSILSEWRGPHNI